MALNYVTLLGVVGEYCFKKLYELVAQKKVSKGGGEREEVVQQYSILSLCSMCKARNGGRSIRGLLDNETSKCSKESF